MDDAGHDVYNPTLNPTEAPAAPAPTEPLSGAIERVVYHRPESGFRVRRVPVRGHA